MPSKSARFMLILWAVLRTFCKSDEFEGNCHKKYINVSDNYYLWPYSTNGAVVISSPPCINEENHLVVQLCDGGKWLPQDQPNCFSKTQICPPGYSKSGTLCIRITEPRKWHNGCSSNEVQITHPTKNSSWISATRKNNFFPYENITPDEHLGTKYQGYLFDINKAESDFEKNCLIFSNGEVQPEDCNNKHPHVCAHQSNFFHNKCPDGFISDLQTPHKCYFKKKQLKTYDSNDITTVTNLEEKILVESIAGDDLCLVYIKNVLQQKKTLTALNRAHWIYKQLKNTDCAIFTLDISKQTSPTLILNFDEEHNEVYLSVYFNEVPHEQNLKIYCFTDASYELKERVEIVEIGRYSQHYKLRLEDYIGRYWCEAFLLSKPHHLKSNEVVAYRKKRGNEFALRLLFREFCTNFDCKVDDFATLLGVASNFTEKTVFRHQSVKVRPMEVFNFEHHQLDLLVHVSSKRKRHVMSEYHILLGVLQNLPEFVEVVFFRSSDFCLRDTTQTGDFLLNWNLTEIGKSAVPQEICVQKDGVPVSRVCGGNFLRGASWGAPSGECSKTPHISETTQTLHDIFITENYGNITLNLSVLTENATAFSSLDVYYVTKILGNLDEHLDTNGVVDVSKILNNLMEVNSNTLKESQNVLNLTDDLLDVVEKHTYKQPEVHLHNYLVKTLETSTLNNKIGVAIYGNPSAFADLIVANVQMGEDFNTEDLVLATFIPNNTNIDLNNITLTVTVFDKDTFFISETGGKVTSKIISVDLVGLTAILEDPLPVYFRQLNEDEDTKCAFWDYGKKTQRHKGRWSTIGGKYLGSFSNVTNPTLKLCEFSHLTHFALLISNEKMMINSDDNITESNDEDDFVLDIITKIGSFLSFLGITGIFLTALLFEKWRQKTGTKILLQLSSAILLELILTQVTNINLEEDGDICVVLGGLLQYAVLSKFGWMLVYAFLQYFRFVTVMRPMPERIILKSAIVGWIFPLVPVLIFSLSNPEDYTPGTRDFCYPRNFSFYLGVLLPVLVFVIINLFVFVKIMYEIFHRKIEIRTKNLQKRQLYLAVLLFFVLGVPWIFGILGEFLEGTHLSDVFTLFFCVTAPLQGSIMFIFYVVLNDETRFKWVLVIKNSLSTQD